MFDEFKIYLEMQGLKAGTVVDYLGRILRVAKAEKLTIERLANDIIRIFPEYNNDGSKEAVGRRSHQSVKNSLKYFMKFTATRVN